MTFTNLSFKHALQARRYVDRALVPVKFFQGGIYNSSFEDGLEPDMATDASRLAEEYTARLVNGRVDRQTGWDVVKPDGSTVEVKFRSLGFGNAQKSGHTVALHPVKDLADKTAEELFVYAYNPALKSVDLFVYPREVYQKSGVYIYYSTATGDYTEGGGKPYLVDRADIQPAVVHAKYTLQRMKTFGVRFVDEQVVNIESDKVRDLLKEVRSLELSFM